MTNRRPQIRIRRAVLGDCVRLKNLNVTSIRALCRDSYSQAQIDTWTNAYKVESYARPMAAGAPFWVAISNRRIVGMSSGEGSRVRQVYVHPRYAGRGIGAKLLSVLERTLCAHGAKVLKLDSSINAIDFYKRQGYRILKRTNNKIGQGPRLPVVTMKKFFSRRAGAVKKEGGP